VGRIDQARVAVGEDDVSDVAMQIGRLATIEAQFDPATLAEWRALRNLDPRIEPALCICGQHTTSVRYGQDHAFWGCFVRRHAVGREVTNVQALLRAAPISREVDQATAARVVDCWHAATGGLMVGSGFAGIIGVRAYRWLRARAGSDARGIAGADAPPNDLVRDYSIRMLRFPDFTDLRVPMRPGQWLVEVDRNGHYHSASSIELGTGSPVHITDIRDVDPHVILPGYLELGATVASEHRWTKAMVAGSVIGTPTARHMRKLQIPFQVRSALVWPDHRRHLDMFYAAFRNARKEWLRLSAQGDLPAFLCLLIYKAVMTTFLGGWMRSQKNHSETVRLDWSDMIMCEAHVRQLVALAKTTPPTLGCRRDAAWFAVDRPGPPAGLVLSEQLGGWKYGTDDQTGQRRYRIVPVTRDLITARKGGPEPLLKALLTAVRSDQYQAPPLCDSGSGQP
jgi:hypothetical protein